MILSKAKGFASLCLVPCYICLLTKRIRHFVTLSPNLKLYYSSTAGKVVKVVVVLTLFLLYNFVHKYNLFSTHQLNLI